MRELIAAVVFIISISSLDLSDREGSVIYGFFILSTIGAAVYFSAAVVERFSKRIQNWFRITPGTPTDVNEEEWAKMGTPGPVPGVQKPTPPVSPSSPSQSSAPPPPSLPESSAPPPPAPEPEEPIDLYDRLPPIEDEPLEDEESEPPK